MADNGIPLRPRLGVVITSWPHEDGAQYAADLVRLFPETAPADQIEIISCPIRLESENNIAPIVAFFEAKALDALCLVPGNFTLDHIMPLMAQAMGLPTLLWGIPTRLAWGALVAIQQTMYPFAELKLPYRFVVGELGQARAWEKVLVYARAAALVRRLKGTRIGIVGWRAQGMSDMTFDELALREVFGVQVLNVGLTRYERTRDALPATDVEAAWQGLALGFEASDLPDPVRQMGVRSYLALKQLMAEDNLQGVTMECFPDHLGEPCLACSVLADQGLAASCETDVPCALLQAAAHILTSEPSLHSDIIIADPASNSAVLGHCGNLPRKLAPDPEHVRLASPRQWGAGFRGPTVEGTTRPGPVTAVNLVGRRGNLRMAALEGAVVPYTQEFPGAWTKVSFPFDLAEALEDMGNAGYGHHFVLMSGHQGRYLAEWCQLLGIDYFQAGA
jgi:L-fucose isomerase-like protein